MLEGTQIDWAKEERELWKPISEMIRKGAIALWPLPVLQLFLANTERVRRRQDVRARLSQLGWTESQEEEARELQKTMREADFPSRGGFTVVCLSFAWLAKDHPDPDGFHLEKLCEGLSRHWWARGERAKRVAVFWDYLSLYQKPRSSEEDVLFKEALSCLDLLYSSPHTRVFRSTGVPKEPPPCAVTAREHTQESFERNPITFEKRGWPTFETFVTGFKPSHLIHHPLTTDSEEIEGQSNATPPPFKIRGDYQKRHDAEFQNTDAAGLWAPVIIPASPPHFSNVLNTKTFTNGSDAATVKDLYRNFVFRTARTVKEIAFEGKILFDDEAAHTLTGLFAFVRGESIPFALRSVRLSRTCACDEALAGLVKELGCLDTLVELDLAWTPAGPQTTRALREAFEKRGMPVLSRLSLEGAKNVAMLLDNKGGCNADLITMCILSQQRERKALVLSLRDTGLFPDHAGLSENLKFITKVLKKRMADVILTARLESRQGFRGDILVVDVCPEAHEGPDDPESIIKRIREMPLME
eukprot:Cvel_23380.t1-p1 / transcript=Cvel_23380.t1 / gene=Cvel_23380 / organism=Chromera_velia_CCMP2878 / gene_product=hypothetical protein / transcript_product=hypothetical protein / location=Cvel_scaffold2402:16583-18163(-) / protein_length=527 / sequence_SO=supercontig / SO=protein_coding / is_pseudo=false